MISISVEQTIRYVAYAIGVLSAFIEISPIKINPWSRLAKWIGRCINKEIIDKVNNMEDKQNEFAETMVKKFDEMEKDSDIKEAARNRSKIIDYALSCSNNELHTIAQWEEIGRTIDDYRFYCNRHNIPNNYIESEITYINSVHDDCLHRNRFAVR